MDGQDLAYTVVAVRSNCPDVARGGSCHPGQAAGPARARLTIWFHARSSQCMIRVLLVDKALAATPPGRRWLRWRSRRSGKVLPGTGIRGKLPGAAVPVQRDGFLTGSVQVPTAHTLAAEAAETPSRNISVTGAGGFGLAARAHFRPFQCRIRVLPVVPTAYAPTAQTFPAATAVTAPSLPSCPGEGVVTRVHFLPFQRRTSVWDGEPGGEVSPTAQALVADTATTPVRSL